MTVPLTAPAGSIEADLLDQAVAARAAAAYHHDLAVGLQAQADDATAQANAQASRADALEAVVRRSLAAQ